jgi:hypothetical protein
MKRIFLFLVGLLFIVSMSAQTEMKTYVYDNMGKAIGNVAIPCKVFVKSTAIEYYYKTKYAVSYTLGYIYSQGGLVQTNLNNCLLIDSTSFASDAIYSPARGVTMLGVIGHHVGIQATDTISLTNLAIGEKITIVSLGATTPIIVKARAGTLVSGDTYLYPKAWTTGTTLAGNTIISIAYNTPVTFYKKDATHIWVY